MSIRYASHQNKVLVRRVPPGHHLRPPEHRRRQRIMESRRLFLLSVSACALSCVALAQTESYPTRTITMIVPFAPGGASDNVARVISQRLADDLGKPVVI